MEALLFYRTGQLFQHNIKTPTINLKQYGKMIKNDTDSSYVDRNFSTSHRPIVLVSGVYAVLPFNKSTLELPQQMVLVFHTEEKGKNVIPDAFIDCTKEAYLSMKFSVAWAKVTLLHCR